MSKDTEYENEMTLPGCNPGYNRVTVEVFEDECRGTKNSSQKEGEKLATLQ